MEGTQRKNCDPNEIFVPFTAEKYVPDPAFNAGFGWVLTLGQIRYGAEWYQHPVYQAPDGAQHAFSVTDPSAYPQMCREGARTTNDGSNLRYCEVAADGAWIEGVQTLHVGEHVVWLPNGELRVFDRVGRLTKMYDVTRTVWVAVQWDLAATLNESSCALAPAAPNSRYEALYAAQITDSTGRQHELYEIGYRNKDGSPVISGTGRTVCALALAAFGQEPDATTAPQFLLSHQARDTSRPKYSTPAEGCEVTWSGEIAPIEPEVRYLDKLVVPLGSGQGVYRWVYEVGFSAADNRYVLSTEASAPDSFDYDLRAGSMKTVTLPSGGAIKYEYEKREFPTFYIDGCSNDAFNHCGRPHVRNATAVTTRTVHGDGLPLTRTYTAARLETKARDSEAAQQWRGLAVTVAEPDGSRATSIFSICRMCRDGMNWTYGLPYLTEDLTTLASNGAVPNTSGAWPGPAIAPSNHPPLRLSRVWYDGAGNEVSRTYVAYDATVKNGSGETTFDLTRSWILHEGDIVPTMTVKAPAGVQRARQPATHTTPSAIGQWTLTLREYDPADPQNRFGTLPEVDRVTAGYRYRTKTVFQHDTSRWILNNPLSIEVTEIDPSPRWLSKTLLTAHDAFGRPGRKIQKFAATTAVEADHDVVTTYAYANEHPARLDSEKTYQVGATTVPAEFEKHHEYDPVTGLLQRTAYRESGQKLFTVVDRTIDPASGLTAVERTPSGTGTRFTYDASGRVKTLIVPEGGGGDVNSTVAYDYDVANRLLHIKMAETIVAPDGSAAVVAQERTVSFDSLGRPVSDARDLPAGGETRISTSYDSTGAVEKTTQSGVGETKFSYDFAGRIIRTDHPDGTVSTVERTVADGTTTVTTTTSKGEVADYSKTEIFDSFGRLLTVSEADATPASYAYDGMDRLRKVTSGIQVRTFEYDGVGNLASETHPESGTTTHRYDALGNEVSRTTATGTVTFRTDAAGRRTSASVGVGSALREFATWEYYPDSDRTPARNQLKVAVRRNTITSQRSILLKEEFGPYDLLGAPKTKRTSVISESGGIAAAVPLQTFVQEYRYSAGGALGSIKYPECAGCAAGLGFAEYSYDAGALARVATRASATDSARDRARLVYEPDTPWLQEVSHVTPDGSVVVIDSLKRAANALRPHDITFAASCSGVQIAHQPVDSVITDGKAQFSIAVSGAERFTVRWWNVNGDGTLGSELTDPASPLALMLSNVVTERAVRATVTAGPCTLESATAYARTCTPAIRLPTEEFVEGREVHIPITGRGPFTCQAQGVKNNEVIPLTCTVTESIAKLTMPVKDSVVALSIASAHPTCVGSEPATAQWVVGGTTSVALGPAAAFTPFSGMGVLLRVLDSSTGSAPAPSKSYPDADGRWSKYRWSEDGIVRSISDSNELIASTQSLSTFTVEWCSHDPSGRPCGVEGGPPWVPVPGKSQIMAVSACPVPDTVVTPQHQVVPPGQEVRIRADVDWWGLELQWYRGEVGDTRNPVAAVPTDAKVISVPGSAASYWVRVTNACGASRDFGPAIVSVDLGGRICEAVRIHSATPEYLSVRSGAKAKLDVSASYATRYTWTQGLAQKTIVASDQPSRTFEVNVPKTTQFNVIASNATCLTSAESAPMLIHVTSCGDARVLNELPSVHTVTGTGFSALSISTNASSPIINWYDGALGDGEAVLVGSGSTFKPEPREGTHTYWARVTTGGCSFDSKAVTVCAPPRDLVVYPREIERGNGAWLAAKAVGVDLTYHWYKGLPPDTSSPVEGHRNGTWQNPYQTTPYWVRVKDACEQTTDSAPVILSVCPDRPLPPVPNATEVMRDTGTTMSVGPAPKVGRVELFRVGDSEPVDSFPKDSATLPDGTTSGMDLSTGPVGADSDFFVRVHSGSCFKDSDRVRVKVCADRPVAWQSASRDVAPGTTVKLEVSEGTASETMYSVYAGVPGDTAQSVVVRAPGIDRAFDVNPMSTTTYWVRAQRGVCFSDTLGLIITVCHPAITDQPDSGMIFSGGGLPSSLELKADAVGALSYEWLRVGTSTPVEGCTTTVCRVSPAVTSDYFMRARTDCGYTDSAVATVTVCVPPSIDEGAFQQALAVRATTGVSLTVPTSGTSLSYRWYEGTSPDTSKPVGSESTYSFVASRTKTYWVRVTGACGTVDSPPVTVSVCDTPTIDTHPVSQRIFAGSATTLSVAATTIAGGPPLEYQWYSAGAPIQGAVSSTFTTTPLTAPQDYYVTVKSGICTAARSNTATVSICALPSVVSGAPNQEVMVGTAVTLTIPLYYGSSTLTYQWYEGVSGDRSRPLTAELSRSLTRTVNSTAHFWAEVTDGTCVSRTTTTTVNVCIPQITGPAGTTIMPGAAATLTTTSDIGGSSFAWYMGLPGDTSRPTGSNAASLVVTPPSTTTYWVRVTGTCGRYVDSGPATVTVCTPSVITTQPQSQNVTVYPTTWTVSVGATGANLTYQWYLGMAGDTSKPFGTSAAQQQIEVTTGRTQAAWVRVQAACGAPVDSQTAYFSYKPAITRQPVSTYLSAGSFADFSVSATGNYLSYQWYDNGAPVGMNSSQLSIGPVTASRSAFCTIKSGTASNTTYTVSATLCNGPQLSLGISGSGTTRTLSAYGLTSDFYDYYQGERGDTSLLVGSGMGMRTRVVTPPPGKTTKYWVRVTRLVSDDGNPGADCSCHTDIGPVMVVMP